MSSHTEPRPWEPISFRNHDTARLFGALARHREAIATHYPLLPVPQAVCTFGYTNSQLTLRAGALVRLWSGWPHMSGPCPECGTEALGSSFGGLLSIGLLSGVCPACARVVRRGIGGISNILGGLRGALSGTPFDGRGAWSPAQPGAPPLGLLAVLQELGEADLPAPSAEGLRPRERGDTGDIGTPRR